jgi:hypothetical protein
MANFVVTIFLILNILVRDVHGATCEQHQARIDAEGSLDSLVTYLNLRLQRQQDVEDIFTCLGQNNMTQRRPTDLIQNFTDPTFKTRNFIYGNGYATRYNTRLIPFWNLLQRFFIRRLWFGKILQIDGSNTSFVTAKNLISVARSMLFYAEVYTKTSIIDEFESVILDYRKEVNNRISKIRDEIREVTYRGVKSGIYLGQAYRYEGPEADINTDAWDDRDNFSFSVNFVLDFRETNQDNIPSWALDDYV